MCLKDEIERYLDHLQDREWFRRIFAAGTTPIGHAVREILSGAENKAIFATLLFIEDSRHFGPLTREDSDRFLEQFDFVGLVKELVARPDLNLRRNALETLRRAIGTATWLGSLFERAIEEDPLFLDVILDCMDLPERARAIDRASVHPSYLTRWAIVAVLDSIRGDDEAFNNDVLERLAADLEPLVAAEAAHVIATRMFERKGALASWWPKQEWRAARRSLDASEARLTFAKLKRVFPRNGTDYSVAELDRYVRQTAAQDA